MEAFGEPQYPTSRNPTVGPSHSGTQGEPLTGPMLTVRPLTGQQQAQEEEEDSRLCLCLCLRLRLGRAKPGQALACAQAVSTRGCSSGNPWNPGPQKCPGESVVTCQASESTHFQPHGGYKRGREIGGWERSRGSCV